MPHVTCMLRSRVAAPVLALLVACLLLCRSRALSTGSAGQDHEANVAVVRDYWGLLELVKKSPVLVGYCPPETVEAFPCGCETVADVVSAAGAQLSFQPTIPKVATAVLELHDARSRSQFKQHLNFPRHGAKKSGNSAEEFWFACHDGTTVRVVTLDESLMGQTCRKVHNDPQAIKSCVEYAMCHSCASCDQGTDVMFRGFLPCLCRGDLYAAKPGLLLFYLATAIQQVGAECRMGQLNSTSQKASGCSPSPSGSAAAATAVEASHTKTGADSCDRFLWTVNHMLNKAWRYTWQKLPYLQNTHKLSVLLTVHVMVILLTGLSWLLGRMIQSFGKGSFSSISLFLVASDTVTQCSVVCSTTHTRLAGYGQEVCRARKI